MAINKLGWFVHDAAIKLFPCPNIEHGRLNSIKGIIVHQTGSASAESTLSGYKKARANGAHFLIDKNGATYQVASLLKQTWHVGKLKSKCVAYHTCTPAQLRMEEKSSPAKINRLQLHKAIPLRYPANLDSIGIELVGLCVLDPKFILPHMVKSDIDTLKDDKGVYETVTTAQNIALKSLIEKIQIAYGVPDNEIFPHPQVSWKNPTEASTAQYPGKR